MKSTNKIVEMLASHGDVDWFAIRPAKLNVADVEELIAAPTITWRYASGTADVYAALKARMTSVTSRVPWAIDYVGQKNITLMPQALHDLIESTGDRNVVDARKAFVANEPAIAKEACREVLTVIAQLMVNNAG